MHLCKAHCLSQEGEGTVVAVGATSIRRAQLLEEMEKETAKLQYDLIHGEGGGLEYDISVARTCDHPIPITRGRGLISRANLTGR